MTAIGGKTKILKPTQPQYVVQAAKHVNEYLKLSANNTSSIDLVWVGDPKAATKFDSKYQAKFRVRELADIPETRCFKELV